MEVWAIEALVERFEALYPDRMLLQEHEPFERGKRAGKVELIQEIKQLIEEGKDVT